MKIINVNGQNNIYSSNVYLVMSDWKRIEDLNTLIDVGNDPSIIQSLDNINTGVGKKKIDQVILTHNHSDHTGILPLIKKIFHPRVFAFSPFLDGVDHILHDREKIRLGDKIFEVIHTPGHSSDSVSLYCEETGVLFVGDTPVVIRSEGGAYEADFFAALKALSQKFIKSIYLGHGDPILDNAQEVIMSSLRNVQGSVLNQGRFSIRNNRGEQDENCHHQ
jgi:glyoxylase-like metal-dependent hydrolase (beta-lactamase superfamily II)